MAAGGAAAPPSLSPQGGSVSPIHFPPSIISAGPAGAPAPSAPLLATPPNAAELESVGAASSLGAPPARPARPAPHAAAPPHEGASA
jgi:hypothetical protein